MVEPRTHTPAGTRSARSARPTLEAVRERAAHCRNCPLWQHATQTVFGAGAKHAEVMLVGEQPGDKEDLAGQPFVGPAGKLLDRALQEAGIDRDAVYVTNAVKHFKFVQSGKRRLHKTPAQREIEACQPWLLQELQLVKPAIVVALGATAARALLGARVPITKHRGQWFTADERRVFLTVHPSSLLRIPGEGRAAAYTQFVGELKQVAAEL